MSEAFELQKKLIKIREELRKREVDVRDRLADIEKKKVDALKKVEDMRGNAQRDLQKVDEGIMKAQLDADAKTRLSTEVLELKQNAEKEYAELRGIILGKATSP